MCSSFHRPGPFVEHLPKKKRSIIKSQKKKDLIVSLMVSFSNTGAGEILNSSILNDILGKIKNIRVCKQRARVRYKFCVRINKINK